MQKVEWMRDGGGYGVCGVVEGDNGVVCHSHGPEYDESFSNIILSRTRLRIYLYVARRRRYT